MGRNKVFSSKVVFIKGDLTEVETIAKDLINILIERYHIKPYQQYVEDNGMDPITPVVKLTQDQKVLEVNLNVPDNELTELGKKAFSTTIKGEDH